MKGEILGHCAEQDVFHRFASLDEMIAQNHGAIVAEKTDRKPASYAPVFRAQTDDPLETYIALRGLCALRDGVWATVKAELEEQL